MESSERLPRHSSAPGHWHGISDRYACSLQRAYMPLSTERAQKSCQGTGHTHGAPQMTVLVTGAGGFIGVHATLMLRRRGHGGLPVSARLQPDVDCKLLFLRDEQICA